MEKICLLVLDHSTKWRHVLPKQQFFDEFGRVDDEEIISHNMKVLDNQEFLMDVVNKLNELDPEKLSDKDNELIANIIEECENLVEKDFISIF